MPRCNEPNCNKKLNAVEKQIGLCRCGNCYCSLHRHPEDHNCISYNSIAIQQKQQLKNQLVKVSADKISNRV